MKDELVLQKFEAISAGGIDHDSPIIIDWTKARKGQGITLLQGDQQTGKTSTLRTLMYLMGVAFNVKELINIKDQTLDTNLKFSYQGSDYHVIASGTRLTLKRHYKDKDRWIPEGMPKETLRTMFGNIGVSPMFLKDLPGKKQIQWFKETFGATKETNDKEQKMQADLDKVFAQRRDVNRMIKDGQGWLNNNDLYVDYEKNQKRFATPISADKEKKKFEELHVKKQEHDKAVNTLDSLRSNREATLRRMEQLRQQLDAEAKSLSVVEKRISDGEQYISQLNGVEKEFEQAQKSFLNISKIIAEQSQWKEVLKKEKELDDYEQTVVIATDKIDQLRRELLELSSTYLPKIKGLEIRTKQMSIDNGDEDEGIFYEGKSLAQLSESEIWDLFMLIWEKKSVFFVFCENISSLGSEAVATLNRLVKDKKAQVFASEVDRKKKEMEITFETAIK